MCHQQLPPLETPNFSGDVGNPMKFPSKLVKGNNFMKINQIIIVLFPLKNIKLWHCFYTNMCISPLSKPINLEKSWIFSNEKRIYWPNTFMIQHCCIMRNVLNTTKKYDKCPKWIISLLLKKKVQKELMRCKCIFENQNGETLHQTIYNV